MKESISKLMILLAGIVITVLGTSIFIQMSVSLYETLRAFFERFSAVILGNF